MLSLAKVALRQRSKVMALTIIVGLLILVLAAVPVAAVLGILSFVLDHISNKIVIELLGVNTQLLGNTQKKHTR